MATMAVLSKETEHFNVVKGGKWWEKIEFTTGSCWKHRVKTWNICSGWIHAQSTAVYLGVCHRNNVAPVYEGVRVRQREESGDEGVWVRVCVCVWKRIDTGVSFPLLDDAQ